MPFYSVECEAPGGGYGPNAILIYDENGRYIRNVEYLDLIFDIWLGGELVQHVQCYCVTARLWNYLEANGITGVSVRGMTVTAGEELNELHPGRIIPEFKELVLSRDLRGKRGNGWEIEKSSIPLADIFTGPGLPLFVNDHAKELLVNYGISGVDFELASVSEAQLD